MNILLSIFKKIMQLCEFDKLLQNKAGNYFIFHYDYSPFII